MRYNWLGEKMTKQEAALKYIEMGMSVIPVGKDKKPLIQWQEFQDRIATPEEVAGWFKKYGDPNIGIVTGKLSNLFIVDVDSAEALQDIEQYIPDSLETPVVSTPRGGRHFYFRHVDGIPNRANVLKKVDVRTQGGFIVAPPSVNGNGKAWQWIRGLDSKISDVPSPLILTLNNAVNKRESKERENQDNLQSLQSLQMFTEGRRDEDLFHTANCLTKGGMPRAEQAQILEKIIESWGESPDKKWIQDKIASAFKRSEKRDRRISDEIRDWVLLTEGYFLLTDAYRDLQILTKEDKNAGYVAINRLQADGIIKKFGEKRGCYEVIKTEKESIIDIYAADATPLNIKFPLNVHDLVKIMPKNIIMIAGEVNAGKSAYLLNLAARNMDRMETVYFSSEMGGAELRERLQHFDFPLEAWKQVKFIERASDFYKAIRPEGLNIIDFLEIHDEFYKMGQLIKDIFDKLTTGLAVIAIQKNKGRDEGLGGERSKEKARLYMAIEPGKLKIVKAKNWISSEINPNGMSMEFKLAKGCKFKPEGSWKRVD